MDVRTSVFRALWFVMRLFNQDRLPRHNLSSKSSICLSNGLKLELSFFWRWALVGSKVVYGEVIKMVSLALMFVLVAYFCTACKQRLGLGRVQLLYFRTSVAWLSFCLMDYLQVWFSFVSFSVFNSTSPILSLALFLPSNQSVNSC